MNSDLLATQTADFLRIAPDPESAALGNNGVANPGGAFALNHNPALLGLADRSLSVANSQVRWLDSVTGSHYAVSLSPPRRWRRWGIGAYYGAWSIDAFPGADASGRVAGRVDCGVTSAALGLAAPLPAGLEGGLALKSVSQSLAVEGQSGREGGRDGALVWDAGLAYQAPFGLVAGAAALNLGRKAGFGRAEEALPRTGRLGLQGPAPFFADFRWSAEWSWSAGRSGASCGLAYSPAPVLAVRIGYDPMQWDGDPVSLNSGVGLNLGTVSFDYAYETAGPMGAVQRLCMRLRFGARSGARTKSAQEAYDLIMRMEGADFPAGGAGRAGG